MQLGYIPKPGQSQSVFYMTSGLCCIVLFCLLEFTQLHRSVYGWMTWLHETTRLLVVHKYARIVAFEFTFIQNSADETKVSLELEFELRLRGKTSMAAFSQRSLWVVLDRRAVSHLDVEIELKHFAVGPSPPAVVTRPTTAVPSRRCLLRLPQQPPASSLKSMQSSPIAAG
jgi:hypothetical protein